MTKVLSNHNPERLVRRNALWNVFGQGLPLVLAVLCIPRLIAGIGTEKFGALTIVWTFLSYFGLFDLGIGRALTQLLASRAQENEKEEAAVVWTVLALLGILGVVIALIVFLSSPFIVSKFLRLQGTLKTETILALRELGLAFPVLINSIALKGILEAKRRFDLSNLIRIPLGMFTYGAPLFVIPFSHNLGIIVAVLLLGRVLALAVNLGMIFRIMPHLRQMMGWEPKRIWELMRFGGWFTVTNVVGPVIDNLDRFFINAMLTISMVAYYTTPFEVVSKMLIIPFGIGGALFPEFAARFYKNPKDAQALYMRGVKYLLALLFPVMLIVTAYAHEGLALWLTPKFAELSGPVLQWLAIYLLIAGVTLVSANFILGIGRPAILSVVHLVELPIHAGILYVFIKFDGIRGAAIAVVIRIVLDFLGQLFFCGALMRFRALTYAKILLPLGLMLVVLFGFHAHIPPVPKAWLVLAILMAHAYVSWALILEKSDKAVVLRVLRGTRRE